MKVVALTDLALLAKLGIQSIATCLIRLRKPGNSRSQRTSDYLGWQREAWPTPGAQSVERRVRIDMQPGYGFV